MSLKAAFTDYFRQLIGEAEAEQFFSSIEAKHNRRTLRVNTLKISKAFMREWLEEQGYTVKNSPFSNDGLEIEERGERLALKLPYHSGFTYPQDASSMFAVELLDPQPGEIAIDLTAAPGGKTTHIAQRMQNKGVLVANDMDTRRLKALHSNLERLGIWNAVVTRQTPHKLSLMYTEVFDRVLLDPSCSGEGLLVTHDGKPSFWNKKSLKRYSAEQFGLLCSAFRLLKPGGRLVYSTCTLNAVEDDGVAERLLEKFPQAQIEHVSFDKGGGVQVPEQIGDLKGLRFWPHKTQTKGFFCIAITKTASLGLDSEIDTPERLKSLGKKVVLQHGHWLKEQFNCSLESAYTLRGDHVFRVSEALLRFPLPTHYSLSFPFLKNEDGILKPSHPAALYLALQKESLVENITHEEAVELFETGRLQKDSEGLKLVCCSNFPIGLMESGLLKLPRQH